MLPIPQLESSQNRAALFRETRVVIRGGGEMASATALLLFRCGFPVVILERGAPLAVRRQVSFAQAIFSGEVRVTDVLGRHVERAEVSTALEKGHFIPVLVDPQADSLIDMAPKVVVDGRMAKRNLDTLMHDAPLVIGLGPGFIAGQDVHAVIETQRGDNMGGVLWSGSAAVDTAVPTPVLGITEERVLRAPQSGLFNSTCRIGDSVITGAEVGHVNGMPVTAAIDGMVRGLLADDVLVDQGIKIGDIDPRGQMVDPMRISDKGRAVAAGVLEAILVSFKGDCDALHPHLATCCSIVQGSGRP